MEFWRNQKPAVAVPLVAKRSMPAYRNVCPIVELPDTVSR
jgi:hypothetical protein